MIRIIEKVLVYWGMRFLSLSLWLMMMSNQRQTNETEGKISYLYEPIGRGEVWIGSELYEDEITNSVCYQIIITLINNDI